MMRVSDLVGRPYKAGACGPDAFDCIGLVRFWFKQQHGKELPPYTLEMSARDLLRFTRATGWKPVEGRALVDDVVTMTGLEGKHVGVMVATSEGAMLLHAVGSEARGQVVLQPLWSLVGYREIQPWRQA